MHSDGAGSFSWLALEFGEVRALNVKGLYMGCDIVMFDPRICVVVIAWWCVHRTTDAITTMARVHTVLRGTILGVDRISLGRGEQVAHISLL